MVATMRLVEQLKAEAQQAYFAVQAGNWQEVGQHLTRIIDTRAG